MPVKSTGEPVLGAAHAHGVAAGDRRGVHPDEHLVVGRHGPLDVVDTQHLRRSVPIVDDCSHALNSFLSASVAGLRRSGPERRDDGEDNSGHRHREVCARDAEQRGAGGDREQDHRGVQVDGAALDDRLEEVALQELHPDDDGQGREPDLPSAVRERDEHGEEAGDERADERHERAHEDEHGEGEGERHAEQPQADPDQRGVDRRDERRPADEAAEHGPGPSPCTVDGRPRPGCKAPQDPAPERGAVAQDEVEHGDRQHQAGDEAHACLDARSGVAGDLLPGFSQRRPQVLRSIQREIERLVLEPGDDVVDRLGDRLDELVVLRQDGARDDRDQPCHDGEAGQEGKSRRRSLEPHAPEPVGDRR